VLSGYVQLTTVSWRSHEGLCHVLHVSSLQATLVPVPLKYKQFDYLSLVPGLREAMGSVSSVLVLMKCLGEALAMYLCTYALLVACAPAGAMLR
jgi:hypothetical protein